MTVRVHLYPNGNSGTASLMSRAAATTRDSIYGIAGLGLNMMAGGRHLR